MIFVSPFIHLAGEYTDREEDEGHGIDANQSIENDVINHEAGIIGDCALGDRIW